MLLVNLSERFLFSGSGIFRFPERWPVKRQPVGVVDQAVEDGIGESGFVDDIVPGFDRELAGDDGEARLVAVFDDLHEVAALSGCQAVWPPIVEDLATCDVGRSSGSS